MIVSVDAADIERAAYVIERIAKVNPFEPICRQFLACACSRCCPLRESCIEWRTERPQADVLLGLAEKLRGIRKVAEQSGGVICVEQLPDKGD